MDTAVNLSLAKMGQITDLNREWEEVLHLGMKVSYSKNAIIPHEQTRGMYYLAEGSVSISYSTLGGRERLDLSIGPGCLFNEARTTSRYEPGAGSPARRIPCCTGFRKIFSTMRNSSAPILNLSPI